MRQMAITTVADSTTARSSRCQGQAQTNVICVTRIQTKNSFVRHGDSATDETLDFFAKAHLRDGRPLCSSKVSDQQAIYQSNLFH